jgi:hypothetical protein
MPLDTSSDSDKEVECELDTRDNFANAKVFCVPAEWDRHANVLDSDSLGGSMDSASSLVANSPDSQWSARKTRPISAGMLCHSLFCLVVAESSVSVPSLCPFRETQLTPEE